MDLVFIYKYKLKKPVEVYATKSNNLIYTKYPNLIYKIYNYNILRIT